MFFDTYPYTDFHELNLDWLIRELKSLRAEVETEIPAILSRVDSVEQAFVELKNYVDTYFDNLDVTEAINERLDEMLADGTFSQLIIQGGTIKYINTSGEYGGLPCVRWRESYYTDPDATSGVNKGTQMGVMYAPSGDYDSNVKYWYQWRSYSDNSDPDLLTIDVANNAIYDTITVTGAQHGGELCIYDSKLYTIANGTLYIFDISAIRPVLLSQTVLSIAPRYVLGFNGTDYLMADANGAVYSVPESLNTATLLYTMDIPDYTLQDMCYDSSMQLIYVLGYNPNTINVFSAIDGVAITSMLIPDVIDYVTVPEPEAISCHGNHIYLGVLCTAGVPGSVMLDTIVFDCNTVDKATYRRGIINTGGVRYCYVDYNTASGLNPIAGGNHHIFKYFEDACNFAQAVNNCIIAIREDYPYSFRVFADCTVHVDNGSSTGAIKIEENISCHLSGVATFTGNPVKYGVTSWVYVGIGAECHIRSASNIRKTTADVGIMAYRSRLFVEYGTYIYDTYIYEGFLFTTCVLDENIYLNSATVVCKGLNITKSSTQYISSNSVVYGKLTNGNTDRINYQNLYTYPIPYNGTFIPATVPATSFRPLPVLSCYGTGDYNFNTGYYYPNDTYNTIVWHLDYQTGTVPVFDYEYVRYVLSVTSGSVPSAVGVFNLGQ